MHQNFRSGIGKLVLYKQLQSGLTEDVVDLDVYSRIAILEGMSKLGG